MLTSLKQFIARHQKAIILAVVLVALIALVSPYLVYAAEEGPQPTHDPVGEAVATVIGWVASIMAWLLGPLASMLIYVLIKIASFDDFIGAQAVVNGWVVVRDIVNMFFILILLIIAIATILKVESYNYKALLPKVLILALLVNFSKTICGVAIDFSQVVMLTFVNGFKNVGAGNFLNATGLPDMLSFKEYSVEDGGVDAMAVEIDAKSVAVSYMLAVLYLIVIVVVLLVMIIIFAFRIVMLWLLIILSPLFFLLLSVPSGASYAKQWSSEFVKYLIVGPLLAFFLWLSLSVFGTLSEDLGAGDGGATVGVTKVGTWGQTYTFVIAIGLLVGGMTMAGQMGVAGGSYASGAVNKMQSLGQGAVKLAGKAAMLPAAAGWGLAKYGERKFSRHVFPIPNPKRIAGGIKKAWQKGIDEDEAAIAGSGKDKEVAKGGGKFTGKDTYLGRKIDQGGLVGKIALAMRVGSSIYQTAAAGTADIGDYGPTGTARTLKNIVMGGDFGDLTDEIKDNKIKAARDAETADALDGMTSDEQEAMAEGMLEERVLRNHGMRKAVSENPGFTSLNRDEQSVLIDAAMADIKAGPGETKTAEGKKLETENKAFQDDLEVERKSVLEGPGKAAAIDALVRQGLGKERDEAEDKFDKNKITMSAATDGTGAVFAGKNLDRLDKADQKVASDRIVKAINALKEKRKEAAKKGEKLDPTEEKNLTDLEAARSGLHHYDEIKHDQELARTKIAVDNGSIPSSRAEAQAISLRKGAYEAKQDIEKTESRLFMPGNFYADQERRSLESEMLAKLPTDGMEATEVVSLLRKAERENNKPMFTALMKKAAQDYNDNEIWNGYGFDGDLNGVMEFKKEIMEKKLGYTGQESSAVLNEISYINEAKGHQNTSRMFEFSNGVFHARTKEEQAAVVSNEMLKTSSRNLLQNTNRLGFGYETPDGKYKLDLSGQIVLGKMQGDILYRIQKGEVNNSLLKKIWEDRATLKKMVSTGKLRSEVYKAIQHRVRAQGLDSAA